jgi:hypothetical protein
VSANKDLENVRPLRVTSEWPTLYRKEKCTKNFDLKISGEATACQTWTLVEDTNESDFWIDGVLRCGLHSTSWGEVSGGFM